MKSFKEFCKMHMGTPDISDMGFEGIWHIINKPHMRGAWEDLYGHYLNGTYEPTPIKQPKKPLRYINRPTEATQ